MIHIDFNEPDTPEWVAWRTKCKTKQERHNIAIEAEEESEVDSKLYKGQKNEVYISLDGPFHGKCAYCEEKIFGDQRGDVEHFRPKNAVKDENNMPITGNAGGHLKEHPGYYWLAYDWKNLLPSCILCNQLSIDRISGRRIGKGEQFPVRGFRAWKKDEELKEDYLLLHPAIDHPEEHLTVDDFGILNPKTDRGKACIDILGLNDRDLPSDRREKYEDIKQKMQLLAQAAARDKNSDETKNLLRQITRIKEGHGEFTFIARKAIADAASCVKAVFEPF